MKPIKWLCDECGAKLVAAELHPPLTEVYGAGTVPTQQARPCENGACLKVSNLTPYRATEEDLRCLRAG